MGVFPPRIEVWKLGFPARTEEFRQEFSYLCKKRHVFLFLRRTPFFQTTIPMAKTSYVKLEKNEAKMDQRIHTCSLQAPLTKKYDIAEYPKLGRSI